MPENRIVPLLQRFKKAVETEQISDIRDILIEINEVYDEIEQDEAVRMRQAAEARTSINPTTSKWESLNRYIHNQTIIEFERGVFLTAAAQYVANPESRSSSELLKSIQDVQEHEQTIVDQRAATDDIIESTTLPPSTEIVTVSQPNSPIPRGDSFEIKVTVQNVGNQPASSVKLTSESELPLNPTTARLETLSASQRVSTSFEGTATKPGTNQITIRLSSDNAGTDKQTITLPVQEEKSPETAQGHLSNEEIVAEVTTSRSKRPKFINLIKRNGILYKKSIKTVPIDRTSNEYFTFESTEHVREFSTSDRTGYWIRRRFTTSSRKLFVDTKVSLLSDHPILLAHINFVNNGNKSIPLDTKPGFVANGIGMGRANLVSPSDPYQFQVAGRQPQKFNAVSKWTTYNLSGEIPYVMAIDSDRALSIGLLEGTTGAEMAMTEGKPHQIRLFVKPMELAPGRRARWTLGITAHEGGSGAVDEAKRLLKIAKKEASATDG